MFGKRKRMLSSGWPMPIAGFVRLAISGKDHTARQLFDQARMEGYLKEA